MPVIGICGAKGSGKDYFFLTLKKSFPHYNIRKIAYADPIKQNIMSIFNLKTEADYDVFKRLTLRWGEDSSNSVLGRQVVREIGMLMREYDEYQFVDYVSRTIQQDPEAYWCITDLRFYNEYESVKHALKGFIVKIKRRGYLYDGHATETELPDTLCDYIIENESNEIGKYEQTVLNVFESIINQGPKVIKL